jgi:hypothetical protein
MKTTPVTTPTHPRTDEEQELLKAASAHKVNIDVDRMLSASNQAATILQAPLRGIERYGDADFSKGAPVVLLIIKSSASHPIPNGSYVVKVEYRPGASSGKATFTDTKGHVAAQRDIVIRTWEQAGVLFPDVYPGGGPLEVAVITSLHVWHDGKWSVDCGGWQPYRVIYFPT